MHAIRTAVRENRLSNPQQIIEASYHPYIEAHSAWVAENGDRIAGFAALDGRSKTVWALFVDPSAERAGVGRALHERMVQWACEQGIGKLWLSTAKHSRAASFYRRAGWIETGSDEEGDILYSMTLPS
jgi:GNAT superfamily N-acetyltransferase